MMDHSLKRALDGTGQPLYVRLAQALGKRIEDGQYSVGGLLPTEAELGEAFGVSRYTVRQAIQHLRHQGLVSARKGVGTRVEARQGKPSYTHSIQSLSELLQYAHETRLDVMTMEERQARGSLAELLRCRPGRNWLHVVGVRYAFGSDQPICQSEIFIDGSFRAISSEIGRARTAICAIIEERFGETIVEVDQQIDAAVLSEEQASRLGGQKGAPALKITRRYFVTGGRLIELSVSLHPADRFTYAMSIRRDIASG